MKDLILIINTGNTSTKIGVFKKTEPVFVDTIRHRKLCIDSKQCEGMMEKRNGKKCNSRFRKKEV